MKKSTLIIACLTTILMFSCTSQEEKARKAREKEEHLKELAYRDSIRLDLERQHEIEAKRQDSIKQEKRRETIKSAIKITSYYLTSPNSASGVSVYFYYKNLSDKPIKYLVWVGYPINRVNDMVTCDIRGYSTYRGKDTGPVKKGSTGGGYWDCAWYNWQAHKLILTGVEIEYMDGTTLNIDGDDLYLIGKKKDKN